MVTVISGPVSFIGDSVAFVRPPLTRGQVVLGLAACLLRTS
jgi:hypothetical protein